MFNTLEIITNHNTTQCPSEGPYRILSCGELSLARKMDLQACYLIYILACN